MAIRQDDGSSFYAVLGVGRTSSAAEIRAAYRKLAMLWHPDKCRSLDKDKVEFAKKKFQQVQEAYNVLSDDGKRALYDLSLYDGTNSENDIIRGLHNLAGELSSMMADLRTQLQFLQDLQPTIFEAFRADLQSWGWDFPAHLKKKRTWETTAQCQQVSVKSQKLSSVDRPRRSCKRRRSVNSRVSELRRPAKSAAQSATDLFSRLRIDGGVYSHVAKIRVVKYAAK